MKKPKQKRNRPIVNDIQFDSKEEVEVYQAIEGGVLWDLIWDKEFNKAKLTKARLEPFLLYEKFKAGIKSFRQIIYTPDFEIKLWNKTIIVEVKSKFTWMKPDYRLRLKIFLILYHTKVNFIEIIKIRKGVWEVKKYY